MTRRRWPRYRLTFEAVPPRAREGMAEPVPAEIRVRQLLKHARRALGLKCVLAESLPAAGDQSEGDKRPC
jgi:hypothetical protein